MNSAYTMNRLPAWMTSSSRRSTEMALPIAATSAASRPAEVA